MRSVKIKEVIDALERFAPLPLQEGYDNAGLQVGLTETEVSGALLCLDVTEEIIDEAIRKGCNLIVAHHPLIFHKLARLSDTDFVQRSVYKAVKNDIAIVAMHTNMDAVQGGVNYKMAEKLGLENLRMIGKRQSVQATADGLTAEGSEGVIGELHGPIAADDLILLLKERFGTECIQANQLLRRSIRKIALCGGAGSFLLGEAIANGADAFITGEMHYHEFFGHEQEIQICSIGHYQSEQYTAELFRDIIERDCPGVTCHLTDINTNPIIYL
ncbi:Nif3-like dinuclear metal center hexameric protein [Prevotella dentasini]|uniref:Nif3-like dinuclear metal center hexameric protein n=1 Tax=Prevotella dentasini TaxID=589537 RepID=UPI00046A262A|nr:Nif3-like dinuclear metal center hexameric protein [Prevotella dentasini]